MINKECRYTMESANTEHHTPDHNHHTQHHWYLVSKGITVHSNASSEPRIWYLVSKGVLQCVACGPDSRLLIAIVKHQRSEYLGTRAKVFTLCLLRGVHISEGIPQCTRYRWDCAIVFTIRGVRISEVYTINICLYMFVLL